MDALDDPGVLAKADPTNFLAAVEGLTAQLVDAAGRARAVDGLPSAAGIRSIAVLGMGGSGISGELCRTVLAPQCPVPVATVRDYVLPAWVGPDTLVFAVSYSGNTEETLAAYQAAAERGARIVAVTTGGTLGELATAAGYPVVGLPGGLMPRAAIGYVGIPPLVVCSRLGLAPGLDDDVDEALAVAGAAVELCRRTVPAQANPAKQLASHLVGSTPVVWGTEGFAAAAAYRWKCQFNENAKLYAGWATFPELNHNEVVGLYQSDAPVAPPAIVILRHPGEHPRTALRIDVTMSLMRPSVAFVAEVHAAGRSDLARLLDLAVMGDFVSTYLGIVRGVDPAPIEAINRLKAALG